jgi:hypothetical protein
MCVARAALGINLVLLQRCHDCQGIDENETFEGSVGPRRFTCLATATAALAIRDSVKGVNAILPVFRLSQGDHARTRHDRVTRGWRRVRPGVT